MRPAVNRRSTVQHVTVNEGGQAIAGSAWRHREGVGNLERERQPHERPAGHAPKPALHRHLETDPAGVSGSGRDRLDCLPVPWRRGGRPKGERNGAYRHGLHAAEAVEERRAVTALPRLARAGMAHEPRGK